MLLHLPYKQAQTLLLERLQPVSAVPCPLSSCGGRILAQDVIAQENIPAFDRSPYDGFALRAADTASASMSSPVTLQIVEEIPAGEAPSRQILPGMAAKVSTGAPIPTGADAVIMYEKTDSTADTVTLYSRLQPGENVVCTGEDVRYGTVLAEKHTVIDPGLAGVLGSQGLASPLVYRRPRVAVLSTGNELVEADAVPENGLIRNSNRYMLETALRQIGCIPLYLGIAADSVSEIADRLHCALPVCDAVVITGGVSVGDHDLTLAAMEQIGVEILFRGVDMKPGMACAYGIKEGKPICGLSGNPASSLTNFYVIALPALKKLAGRKDCLPQEIPVILTNGFPKHSKKDRFLRGIRSLEQSRICMTAPSSQGNVVLSSSIGCDIMAVIPAGSGPVPAGAVLPGFFI